MNEATEFCPFEPAGRAERCLACAASSPLPPCARNWLRARLEPGAVTPLVRERREPVGLAA